VTSREFWRIPLENAAKSSLWNRERTSWLQGFLFSVVNPATRYFG
jgi:threonine/homoserine/homoserine lactone efflux protein